MTDLFDRLMWAYRAVFTQTNAGGGNILANFVARERMLVLYGVIGSDDYAADRNVIGVLKDSDDNTIGLILLTSPVDNELIPFPMDKAVAVTNVQGNQFFNQITLGKGDYLQIKAATPVLNETLTIAIRALVPTSKPSVNTTGSGGTVTTTVTYDKVI